MPTRVTQVLRHITCDFPRSAEGPWRHLPRSAPESRNSSSSGMRSGMRSASREADVRRRCVLLPSREKRRKDRFGGGTASTLHQTVKKQRKRIQQHPTTGPTNMQQNQGKEQLDAPLDNSTSKVGAFSGRARSPHSSPSSSSAERAAPQPATWALAP